MKTILLFCLGLAFMCQAADAQTVLLNVDRKTEQRATVFGPNLKKFVHFYIRGGFASSEDKPGARIIYGSSVNLAMGVRKKFKISSVYSMGWEMEYQYTDYKLKQEKDKVLPDTVINNTSERLDYSALSLGYYNRFNFDPHRGNFLGTYLDLGITALWNFSIIDISKNEQKDGSMVKTVISNLPYTNGFQSNVFARLGFSHIAIFGSYRLTELFKSSYNYPDLPRVMLGIDLAVF